MNPTPHHQTIDVTTLAVSPAEDARQKTIDSTRAEAWQTQAMALKIETQGDYDRCIGLLDVIKDLKREAHEHHDDVIKKAYAAHKAAVAMLKRIEEPLDDADRILRRKLAKWTDEQAAIEAARLAEERRKEEERRAQELEAMRLELEAKQKAALEEAERQIELAEASGAKPQEINNLVVELERSVDGAMAQERAIVEEAMRAPIAPVTVTPTYQAAKGISTPKRYSATVTNKRTLIEFVAMNPQYLSLLEPNQSALDKLARALENNYHIPGTQLVCTTGVTNRR